MRKSLPADGRAWDDLEPQLDSFAADAIDWRHGRAPLFVFKATDSAYEVGRLAYFKFFTENALGGGRAFHGVKKMEDEVLEMGLSLFAAPDDGAGNMTTGGTESIFLAVKAARDRFRSAFPDRGGPLNIVAPFSAHPAFDKAGRAMDIAVHRVPLGPDFRADVPAMAATVDARTIMLVGSAPCFSHGVVDPIEALGALALEHDGWLHVDACVGGYMLPFIRRIGRPVPAFDFSVPGVRSISADLHKFGFCPKPASTVFYRDREDYERQIFDFDSWPSGRFVTPMLSGTRPGGAVAAAWAVFNHLGEAGYCEIAERLMAMTDRYLDGIRAIEGLEVWGAPHATLINFGSRRFDVFAVAEQMRDRGWLPGLTRTPKGMHMMMSLIHEEACDAYLGDLAAGVEAVAGTPDARSSLVATY